MLSDSPKRVPASSDRNSSGLVTFLIRRPGGRQAFLHPHGSQNHPHSRALGTPGQTSTYRLAHRRTPTPRKCRASGPRPAPNGGSRGPVRLDTWISNTHGRREKLSDQQREQLGAA